MAIQKNLIHIVTMGGTIDSSWSGLQDAIVVSEQSSLPAYFKKFPLIDELTFTHVCAKDSRAITEEDLKNLLKAVEESKATRIIITHGTFTMPDTARFLLKKLKRKDQTIMLTGATTPLRGFEMTDAPLNLGYAISHVQHLSPNVYIAMKGESFSSEEIDKELKEGNFHEIFSSENI